MYKITERIGTYRYKASKAFTRLYRFVLRLEHPARTDIDWMFIPKEEETRPGVRTMDSDKLSESVKNSVSWYHAKPRREYYAEKVDRFIFYNPVYKWPSKIRYWVRKKIDLFILWRVKEFTYESYHYISREREEHIDGYITYKWRGLKRRLAVDITSMKAISLDASRFQEKEKVWYVNLDEYGSYGYIQLLMPTTEYVDVPAIPKLLQDWYLDQTQYKYRHWTSKGACPRVFVDLSFEDELDKILEAGNEA